MKVPRQKSYGEPNSMYRNSNVASIFIYSISPILSYSVYNIIDIQSLLPFIE